MWYSPGSRQKLEQLIQIGSRTSGELLLPVSRRPSHWEMISQRNNGAPSRIPNRISPGWLTWQTVALLLCSWILTHTMPWRHLLIEIAPSQFIKGDQADHMGHKLSGKLHKLGPCQRLLTTKSDLTQMTTYFSRWTLTPSLFFSWWTHPMALSHGELSAYSSFIIYFTLLFIFCFHNNFFPSHHPRWDLTLFRSYYFALENYHLWDSIENGKEIPVAHLDPLQLFNKAK